MDKRVLGVLLGVLLASGTASLYGHDNQDLVASGNKAAQAKVFNIKSYGAIGDGVGMYWYGNAATTSNRKPDPEGALAVPPLPDIK